MWYIEVSINSPTWHIGRGTCLPVTVLAYYRHLLLHMNDMLDPYPSFVGM